MDGQLLRWKKSFKKYQIVGLLYISPWVLGFLAFQLYPFISSFWYSFTDLKLLRTPHFVGFANYIKIFTNDSDFIQSSKVTLIYVLIAVPSKIIFALLIALLLNLKLRGINFYRTVFYLPSILGGSVAVAALWRFLFTHDGIVNYILAKISVNPIDWLGSPSFALFTISLLTVWQFGSSMVLFLAGLKQIPVSLYEAARIDGASRIRAFFNVTLPLLTPILFFNLVMQMVNAFQEFTGAFVITHGGPLKTTYLYGLMLYERAFKYFQMGYASALSWVLFAVIFILTMIVFTTSKYWVHYEDGGDHK